MKHTYQIFLRWTLLCTYVMALIGSSILHSKPTYAAGLSNRSVRLSSAVAGATVTHRFGMTLTVVSNPIGSIQFEYCSNSPIIGDTCDAPVGFSASGLTINSQSGNTGFSVHGNSTSSKIILTRFPILPSTSSVAYVFDSIVNPTTAGTYYVRIQTFSSTNASGSALEGGGVAFQVQAGLAVTAEVPPYIRFCAGVTVTGVDCSTATGSFINLGEFSTTAVSTGTSEFVVATNAGSGFTVSASGTTLTSGNNTIPALTVPTSSEVGDSQFGINLRANATPSVGSENFGPGTSSITTNYNVPNLFMFKSGEAIVSSANSSDSRHFTVSYLANISKDQAPGYYVTTISFICLANF